MPLFEEAKGYEYKGKTPTGRAVVEVKGNEGKLSLWAQDLKPEVRYTVYLVFSQKGQPVGVNMGRLDVTSGGKAELRKEIPVLDGFSLKDIIAVAVTDTGKSGLLSPLCGYKAEKVQWRHGFKEWSKEEPKPKPEKPATVQAAPPVVEAPVPAAPPATAPVPPAVTTPPRATIPDEVSSTASVSNSEDADLQGMLTTGTNFEPFIDGEDGIEWLRVEKLNDIPTPANNPNLFTEPFMQQAWADYEHFILGINQAAEGQELILGVPGVYSADSYEAAKRLGFTMFRSKKTVTGEDEGYWLMALLSF